MTFCGDAVSLVKWPISAHYARPARSSTGADHFALLASSALLARVDLVDQARTAIAAAAGGDRRIAAAAQATTTTAHCGGRREAVKQSRRPRRATADQNCARRQRIDRSGQVIFRGPPPGNIFPSRLETGRSGHANYYKIWWLL
jgi:hypothetical protein